MKKSLFALITAIIFLFGAVSFTAAAEENAFDLVVQAPEKSESGDEFTVTVKVGSISKTLHTLQFELHYDSEKLEITTPVNDASELECISRLPKNWENFSVLKSDGVAAVYALTANLRGLRDGEIEFAFNFRVKDGASGEAKIEIAEGTVKGATVRDTRVDEYAGKGGSAVIDIDDGAIGSVSAVDESVEVSDFSAPEDEPDLSYIPEPDESLPSESEEATVSEPEQTIGGISVTAWIILSAAVVALIGFAAYSVKFKKK